LEEAVMHATNLELSEHEQLVLKMRTVYSIDRQRQELRDDFHRAMAKLDAQRDALRADIMAAAPEVERAARVEAKRLEVQNGETSFACDETKGYGVFTHCEHEEIPFSGLWHIRLLSDSELKSSDKPLSSEALCGINTIRDIITDVDRVMTALKVMHGGLSGMCLDCIKAWVVMVDTPTAAFWRKKLGLGRGRERPLATKQAGDADR
jgi:hypothetical protein